MKPHGLWLSVQGEDDWKSWCEAEQFNLESFKHTYQIILHDNADILHISTLKEIDAFSKHYAKPIAGINLPYVYIDWVEVAKDYDGIIIAPYLHKRRYTDHTFWYWGWDCASGCIWRTNTTIKKVIEIK